MPLDLLRFPTGSPLLTADRFCLIFLVQKNGINAEGERPSQQADISTWEGG
jgi:hypothetical protein